MGRATMKHILIWGEYFLRSEINAFIQIHKGIESNREVKQDIPTLTIQDAEND